MSETRVNLLSNAAGTGPTELHKQSAAKAWANLNGTGTIALRGSFGISSVVDNGVGNYTLNFTNSFSSNDYAVSLSGMNVGAVPSFFISTNSPSQSASSIRYTHVESGVGVDSAITTSEFNGDLA